MSENETQIAVVYTVTVEALRAELEPLKLATFDARQRFEAEAKARAEREAIEAARRAEEERVADAERRAALEARLAALRPDQEKVRDFAAVIRGLEYPYLTTDEGRVFLRDIASQLDTIASVLECFGAENVEAAE